MEPTAHHAFLRLRDRAIEALARREQTLASAREQLPAGHPLHAQLGIEAHRLRTERVAMPHQDPARVLLTLQACLTRLAGLELRVDLALDVSQSDGESETAEGWRDRHPTSKLFGVIREMQAVAGLRDD